MASGRLRNERPDPTLQPTMVVNEVFLRMFPDDCPAPNWDNRAHFFGSVGRAMSQFLIDHARARNRLKRGGDRTRVSFEVSTGEFAATETYAVEDLARAGEAFKSLQAKYPRPASVAWLRWVQGCTIAAVAEALGIAESTVSDDWKFAQAWLRRALGASDA